MQTLKKLLALLCFAALATPAHAIQQLIKSGAAEPIPVFVVDSTGAPVTGVGTAFTVTVRKPGASAYVAASGTVAEDGNGVYDYTPSTAETTISASRNVLLVHAVVTSTATSFGDASAQIVAFDPSSDLGAAALATIGTTTTSTNTQTTAANQQSNMTTSLSANPVLLILSKRTLNRQTYNPATKVLQLLNDDGTNYGPSLTLTIDANNNITAR